MASSYDGRRTFIRSVVDYLRNYRLDGVDIDWEYPGALDRGVRLQDVNSYRQVDYFNLMSYNIFGMWDEDNEWTGPYLRGHTDWDMIENGLGLLWRNSIEPENVVMGFGFYGRSFTITGGMPGSYSDTAGVLTYQEIASCNSSLDVQTFYDPDTKVLYNVFEGSQWVSYDNAVSLKAKLERLSSRSPSGPMIWAIDQDTSNFTAMGELFGDYSHLQLEGLDHDSADRLSDLFGQFTGQDCFVTEKCTDGTSGERGAGQVCPAGTMSVKTAHNPLQRHPMPLSGGTCKKGCTKVIDDCIWSGYQGLLAPSQNPECPDGYDYQTYRYNKPEGVGLCREEYVSPVSGKKGSPLMELFKSALCCPKAIWQYDTQYESNDRDPIRADGTVPDGSDAYGLMMLNGEEEAIDDNFQKSYTVVRHTVSVPRVKRDILTKNQTVLERVFEHVEETFQAYCNFPPGADECEAVWNGGAEDTIIRLPDHVGEGPFARVISMMPVGNDYQLPKHHLQHRSLDGIHHNPVYEVKVDYNFHLARQDRGPVQFRVDFTNLLGYWSELTDSEADGKTARRAKKNIPDEGFTMRHFRDRVAKAEESEKRLPKRSGDTILTTVPLEAEPADSKPDNCLVSRENNIAKRWWGTFTRWLAKLTTVTRSEVGDLPMGWADKINLFKASRGCPGKTWSANPGMDLEAEITMQSTYAYYYSGTFIPPTKPDVFFFFGIQPEAYVGLKMVGNAELRYPTNKKKIVDTLGYPGLAVKGIAAIGPTLDIYGQINGYVNIHGEAKAGARVTFDKSRVFWPQDSSDFENYDEILNLGLTEEPKKPNGLDVTPTFEAGVQVKAEVDVIIQPEANAKATVLDWANWALKDRLAYAPDPRKYTIYKSSGSIDLQGNRKRMVRLIDQSDSEDDTGQSYANDTLAETALLDPMYLFKRQDDDSMDLEPQLPQFTQQIQCPASDSPSLKLPELRFNCGAFPPLQLTDVSGQVWGTIPLCQGYKTTTLPTTLTHALAILPEHKERVNQRRKQQCPNVVSDLDSCPYETAFMHSAIGYSGSLMKLECDEFPWASSEEGASKTVWEVNALNVGKMDPETDPDDRDDLWIGWFQGSNTDFWYTQKTVDGVTQGWSSYEENQPVPVGYDPVNWSGQPADKSWTFKRNYTFSVIDDGSQARNWWDTTGKQFTTNTGYTFRNPNGHSSVICAGNAAEFNGLYYRGNSYAANGWPGSSRYSRCKVHFGAAVTKRSEGDAAGERDEWEITGVTMLDDDFVVGEDVDWDLMAKQDAGQKT
ncbi:hypothetical protein K4K59_009788 [Colletotrichum sp. SAR11_240]|nr:hypothetical protein K4K59_009788 [Colletotrichum sp. SAR11_240]